MRSETHACSDIIPKETIEPEVKSGGTYSDGGRVFRTFDPDGQYEDLEEYSPKEVICKRCKTVNTPLITEDDESINCKNCHKAIKLPDFDENFS